MAPSLPPLAKKNARKDSLFLQAKDGTPSMIDLSKDSQLRLPPLRGTLEFSRQALKMVSSWLSSSTDDQVKPFPEVGDRRRHRAPEADHDSHWVAVDVLPDAHANWFQSNKPRRANHRGTDAAVAELTRAAVAEHRKSGADLRRALGLAPLQSAVHSGDLGAVRCLLDAGASPGQARHDGLVPLHFAAQGGHTSIAIALIKAGSPVAPKGPGGFTPLHDAAHGGHARLVEVLLQANAPPDAAADDGATPLHVAAQWGHDTVIALLLRHGASPATRSCGGFTPLHDAAYCNHMPAARLLLDCGARLTKSADGASPLHLAAKAGHTEMVSLLSEHAVARKARRDGRASRENVRRPVCA